MAAWVQLHSFTQHGGAVRRAPSEQSWRRIPESAPPEHRRIELTRLSPSSAEGVDGRIS
jgi:hypothetical protein